MFLNSTLYISLDHGLTYTAVRSFTLPQGAYVWLSNYLYGGYVNGTMNILSTTAYDADVTTYGHNFTALPGFHVLSDKLVAAQNNYIWKTYNLDPLNNARYGLSFNASIIEEDA